MDSILIDIIILLYISRHLNILLFLELPDYSKITFPETSAVPLSEILATGDCSPAAIDLFQGFITYDAGRRRSAQEALDHYYFMEEDPPAEPIHQMPIPM